MMGNQKNKWDAMLAEAADVPVEDVKWEMNLEQGDDKGIALFSDGTQWLSTLLPPMNFIGGPKESHVGLDVEDGFLENLILDAGARLKAERVR